MYPLAGFASQYLLPGVAFALRKRLPTQMLQPIPPMGGYGDSGVEGEAVPIDSERLRRARSLWCQRSRQSRIGDGQCALAGLRADRNAVANRSRAELIQSVWIFKVEPRLVRVFNQSALVHQLAQGARNDAIE